MQVFLALYFLGGGGTLKMQSSGSVDVPEVVVQAIDLWHLGVFYRLEEIRLESASLLLAFVCCHLGDLLSGRFKVPRFHL